MYYEHHDQCRNKCELHNGKRLKPRLSLSYVILCTVYSVQCTVYNVQRALYFVHGTMFNIQCALYNVQCTVYTVLVRSHSKMNIGIVM